MGGRGHSINCHNPYEDFPEGRPRNWLRGRSKLELLDGVAEIRWQKDITQKVSEEIKEKHSHAEASGVSWVREKDLPSACLGPEQPGRVRGVSSSMGWKHAWPEFSYIYKKRRRTTVDVEAMKHELKAELTRDIMSMLASQGWQPQPFSRDPSPPPGRSSSCASASEVGHEQNNADPVQMEMEHNPDQDQIELEHFSNPEPTPCSLTINRGGYQMEVARGQVYPEQTMLHIVPILDGYVVVKVEYVHSKYANHVLVPPPNDEIMYLGQAVLQRIQWRRNFIVLNPTSMDGPQSMPQPLCAPSQPRQKDNTSSCAAVKSAPIVLSTGFGAVGNVSIKDADESVPEKQEKITATSAPARVEKQQFPKQPQKHQPTEKVGDGCSQKQQLRRSSRKVVGESSQKQHLAKSSNTGNAAREPKRQSKILR